MNKLFIIQFFLLLSACQAVENGSNRKGTDATGQYIHPSITGAVKKLGRPVPDINITLSSASCPTITVATDHEGKFTLKQSCNISDTGPGTILDTPTYLFDISITDDDNNFIWSTINPFGIKVEFDLAEQMVCATDNQDTRCTNLVSLTPP